MLRILISFIVIVGCSAASRVWAQDSDRAWGALAVYEGDGAVAYGSGYGATQTAASSAAVADCLEGVTPGHPCRAVRTFNKGCAYIAAGCNEATRRCGYSIAPTQAGAQSQCTRQGFSNCEGEGGCVSSH